MSLINSNEVQTNEIPKTKDAQIQVLTPEVDEDFIVRKINIQANGTMPNHTNKIQHQQYVLGGEAKVFVGDEVYHAKEGDFIYIPAGVSHSYTACYNKSYQFLCMITTAPDEIKMI